MGKGSAAVLELAPEALVVTGFTHHHRCRFLRRPGRPAPLEEVSEEAVEASCRVDLGEQELEALADARLRP